MNYAKESFILSEFKKICRIKKKNYLVLLPCFDKILCINVVLSVYAKANENMGAGCMKVYLDVFFAVNFAMDLLIFEIMNLFLKKRPVSIRGICAAAAGALFSVLVVVTGIKSMTAVYVFMYVFVSCLIIRIAYGKTTVYGMGKYIAGYYITGVFTAGTMLFLKEAAGLQHISILFLLSSALLILFFAQKILLSRSHGMSSGQDVFPVRIRYKGKSVTATGFLDTGNNLYEPVSHECVTVVEYKLFQKMLTEREKADFGMAMHDGKPELFGKLLLRYIPFHSLGRECDYLLGVRADDMEIQIDGGETLHTGKVWLGIYDRFLSADGGYEVLLNSGLFRK